MDKITTNLLDSFLSKSCLITPYSSLVYIQIRNTNPKIRKKENVEMDKKNY